MKKPISAGILCVLFLCSACAIFHSDKQAYSPEEWAGRYAGTCDIASSDKYPNAENKTGEKTGITISWKQSVPAFYIEGPADFRGVGDCRGKKLVAHSISGRDEVFTAVKKDSLLTGTVRRSTWGTDGMHEEIRVIIFVCTKEKSQTP